jgi:hypothetical protein
MSVELNVQDDFSTILDGGEAITLKRRDSAETIVVPTAWRYSLHAEEVVPSGGHVVRADMAWQFSWDHSLDRPRLGDVIIDSLGECWTILVVDELGARTRLRCKARNLRVAYQLTDRVDVQQGTWQDVGSGPEFVDGETVRAAVPARIQPQRVEIEKKEEESPTSTAIYRIILGEQLQLDHDSAIIDPQGNLYQLIELTQAERIDALPVATVVKRAAGT